MGSGGERCEWLLVATSFYVWLYNPVSMLENIESHILSWWTLWYVKPNSIKLFLKGNIHISSDWTIPLLGLFFSGIMKAYVRTETCIQIFMATFFLTAKTGNKPNVQQQVNWLKKLWYIQIREYLLFSDKRAMTSDR